MAEAWLGQRAPRPRLRLPGQHGGRSPRELPAADPGGAVSPFTHPEVLQLLFSHSDLVAAAVQAAGGTVRPRTGRWSLK